jgi:poly(A) polymerase
MASERQYGLTAPISTTFPTEADKRATDELIKELHAQGTFESAAETQKRYVTAVFPSNKQCRC